MTALVGDALACVEHCVYLKDVKIDGLIDSEGRPFHSFLCGKGLVLSPKWV